MIDIIPTIADMLADIGTVELQFPDATADFPVITLSEIANQSDTILHGAERLSVITVQIDVWDKADTPAVVADMSARISAVMVSKGFRRIFGQMMPDGELQRKCMRFSAKIDELNHRVYNS